MSGLIWSLTVLPLAAGAALTAAGRRAHRAAPALGVAVAAVTLGLAVAAAFERPETSVSLFTGMRAGLAVDGLSAVMVITVTAVTTAVLLFATGEFDDREDRGRFFGVMLIFSGAMLVTVTATTLPLLLMAWEVMGASSWALIGYWWRQPERVQAADTSFLTTRAADLGLYLAAGAAVAGGTGSLRLDALQQTAQPWLDVVTAGIVAAALGKSAQLPFSFWLSRAMQGPSPVSALLHSATMVAAGAYLLLRLHPLLAATSWAGPVVAWAGAATALCLGLVAVAQKDLKQLLAGSTAAQIGFMVLAAGSGGVAAGTTQLVAHAATKSALFLAAGAWLTALGTKQLPALRGAARRNLRVGACFTLAALTLAGVPPLSLWAAKDEVLASARAQNTGLYAVGLAAAALAAVYSVKAVWYVTRPEPGDAEEGYDTEQPGTRHIPRVAAPTLIALTAIAAVLGVLALPGPATWLGDLVASSGEPRPQPWETALSAGVALAAIGATWWYPRLPTPVVGSAAEWAGDWLYLERLANAVVVRPVLGLARALAIFDDRVVDGAVRALADGARNLGHWARRPQTGLLHQYYAQAATGFGVLVLIVLLVR